MLSTCGLIVFYAFGSFVIVGNSSFKSSSVSFFLLGFYVFLVFFLANNGYYCSMSLSCFICHFNSWISFLSDLNLVVCDYIIFLNSLSFFFYICFGSIADFAYDRSLINMPYTKVLCNFSLVLFLPF